MLGGTMTSPEQPRDYSPTVHQRARVLYEQDQAQWQQRQALAGALEEMQIPAEYVERAAAEVARELKGRNRRAIALLAAMSCIGAAVWAFRQRPNLLSSSVVAVATPASAAGESAIDIPTSPGTYALKFTLGIAQGFAGSESIGGWRFEHNVDTEATLSLINDGPDHFYGHIDVKAFVPDAEVGPGDEAFSLNLTSNDGSWTFIDEHTLSFRARAEGVTGIRFTGAHYGQEMWSSEPIELNSTWKTYAIDLDHLHHFVKSKDEKWHLAGNGAPDHIGDLISNIQLDMGEHVNDINAHGYIDIGDVVVQ
jgi:hypothetical protein